MDGAHGAVPGPEVARHGALDRYVRSAPSPPLTALRGALWPGGAVPSATDLDDAARGALLAQYTAYVESADRTSSRRGTANAFFLTLNTTVVTAWGVVWQRPVDVPPLLLVAPWFALLTECLAWFWILRSYRQLNSAKYAVVGALEEALPASPWWRAEWSALGQGRDPARYWPLSHVEQLVPGFFAVAYTIGFVVVAVTTST